MLNWCQGGIIPRPCVFSKRNVTRFGKNQNYSTEASTNHHIRCSMVSWVGFLLSPLHMRVFFNCGAIVEADGQGCRISLDTSV